MTVSLGLLWPKVGAAVSMVLSDGAQTIVICTGDGLTTITLGPDGTPASAEVTEEAPCTIGPAIATDAAPDMFWQALARDHALKRPLFERTAHPERRYDRRRPARAPPSLIV